MLLVVRTEAAVERTAILDLCAEGERDRTGLVVLAKAQVHLGVAIDERLERPMVRAPLRHVHLVVPQENLRVDHLAAFGTDAPRQFIEDVIGILLLRRGFRHQCRTALCGDIAHPVSTSLWFYALNPSLNKMRRLGKSTHLREFSRFICNGWVGCE